MRHDVLGAAHRIGLSDEAKQALAATLARIDRDVRLAETFDRLARALRDRDPVQAIAEVKAARLEQIAGCDARAIYLALALSQVAAAESCHAARGIEPEVSLATLADIDIWVRHFARQIGITGITVEILDWAQHYLRGELYRIGALQFDRIEYRGLLRVYRHRVTRERELVWIDGERRIDPSTGEIGEPAPHYDPAVWEIAFEPGMPALDMHIPSGAKLSVVDFARSIDSAYSFFARHAPGTKPAAVCGEAWLLDPQMQELLPKSEGLHAFRRSCALYPSSLPEAKTIRRLFGPDVVRADLPSLPKDGMTSLHRAVVAFLSDPSAELRARGGLILTEEFERVRAALFA
jgi:hypothetical protein